MPAPSTDEIADVAPTIVRLTERGAAACAHACPPGLDAVECARAWQEVVPCACACHAPVAVTSAVVLDLAGLPVVGRAAWVRVPTVAGTLLVPGDRT
jgi:hypothetical protein